MNSSAPPYDSEQLSNIEYYCPTAMPQVKVEGSSEMISDQQVIYILGILGALIRWR